MASSRRGRHTGVERPERGRRVPCAARRGRRVSTPVVGCRLDLRGGQPGLAPPRIVVGAPPGRGRQPSYTNDNAVDIFIDAMPIPEGLAPDRPDTRTDARPTPGPTEALTPEPTAEPSAEPTPDRPQSPRPSPPRPDQEPTPDPTAEPTPAPRRCPQPTPDQPQADPHPAAVGDADTYPETTVRRPPPCHRHAQANARPPTATPKPTATPATATPRPTAT
jgi:hypothetical protein